MTFEYFGDSLMQSPHVRLLLVSIMSAMGVDSLDIDTGMLNGGTRHVDIDLDVVKRVDKWFVVTVKRRSAKPQQVTVEVVDDGQLAIPDLVLLGDEQQARCAAMSYGENCVKLARHEGGHMYASEPRFYSDAGEVTACEVTNSQAKEIRD
jgi:hypothetical protein